MMKKLQPLRNFCLTLMMIAGPFSFIYSQSPGKDSELDARVRKFLANHEGTWHDLNVPAVDGQTLYDIIVKNNYKSALEIGTSTGRSGIWIAWALSKTGGKLITIDINESRHNTAVKNFREAGLSDLIDARLADAHTLVRELRGPFDFIFSDADKDWYKQYFLDLDPKLAPGGCFASHNVFSEKYRNGRGQEEYLEYVRSLPDYETTVNEKGAGLAISYKKSEK